MARRGRRGGSAVAWVVALLLVAAIAGGIVWFATSQQTGPERTITCRVTEKGHDDDGVGYIESTPCGFLTVPSNTPLDHVRTGRTYRLRVVQTQRPLGFSSTRVVAVEGEVQG